MPLEKPVPAAVPVKDTPPADLLRCADRGRPLPEDDATSAEIPKPVRNALIAVARAFAANASQLDRLVNWFAPNSCPAPATEPVK